MLVRLLALALTPATAPISLAVQLYVRRHPIEDDPVYQRLTGPLQ